METLNIDLFYFDGISNSQIINTTRCLHNISKQLDKFIFMQTSSTKNVEKSWKSSFLGKSQWHSSEWLCAILPCTICHNTKLWENVNHINIVFSSATGLIKEDRLVGYTELYMPLFPLIYICETTTHAILSQNYKRVVVR